MYIYKITNNINNKVYIGKCELSLNESQNYYGSGILIKRAIKKYGKENFSKTIICFCNSVDELNDCEKLYVHMYKTFLKENCYNIAEGGTGGNSQRYYSQEQKDAFKNKMSELVKGDKNPFYNKHHTDETKQKISKSKKGICTEKMLINLKKVWEINRQREYKKGFKHSPETIAKLKELQSGQNNGMYGKHHSEHSKQLQSEHIKQSKQIKFKCPFCGKEVDKGNFNRWHGENCKFNPNK